MLAQKARGAQLQSRTCMESLGWHPCRRRLDCVIWASRLRRDRLVVLLERWLLHLTQTLLHYCFAIYWQLDLTGPAVQAQRAV